MADRAEVSAFQKTNSFSPTWPWHPLPPPLTLGPCGVRPGPVVSPSSRSQGSKWEPESQGSHPQALTWDALYTGKSSTGGMRPWAMSCP